MILCPWCHEQNPGPAGHCRQCGADLSAATAGPAAPTSAAFHAELLALLQGGQKIEAIRRYRAATGCGLREAKEAVEHLQANSAATVSLPERAGPQLPASVEDELISLLVQGRKIEAIKQYREWTGVDLRQAKDAVEQLAAARGLLVPAKSGCLPVLLVLAIAGAAVFSGQIRSPVSPLVWPACGVRPACGRGPAQESEGDARAAVQSSIANSASAFEAASTSSRPLSGR